MRSVGRGSRPRARSRCSSRASNGSASRVFPSARTRRPVLANAVLAQVDRSLREAGIEHLRWVDDVVLTGGEALAALSVFRAALATIGLRPNEAKTRILSDARGLVSTATVSAGS